VGSLKAIFLSCSAKAGKAYIDIYSLISKWQEILITCKNTDLKSEEHHDDTVVCLSVCPCQS